MIKAGMHVMTERQGKMTEGVVVKVVDAMAIVQFPKSSALVPLNRITPLEGRHDEEQAR